MKTGSESQTVRRGRMLLLLEAAEHAGLTPIPLLDLHALAFFANVLSPVWDLLPQERSVVRRRGGPYYPELQEDVDVLVGNGLVSIEGLTYVAEGDSWRLEGKFSICGEGAYEVGHVLRRFEDENRLFEFYRELAFALATVPGVLRARTAEEDPTYGDRNYGEGAVIDFAQWRQKNYSENAARHFDEVMPNGRAASAAQKLHLYARHLRSRLRGAI